MSVRNKDYSPNYSISFEEYTSLPKDQLFERIFQAYWKKIVIYFYYRTESTVLADELAAEVFFKILRNIERYVPTAPTGAWVYAIARNQLANWKRAKSYDMRRFHQETKRDGNWINPLELEADPDDLLEQAMSTQEERELLLRAFHRLPGEYQSLLWWHHVEGKTHLEIATLTGKTEQATRAIIYRARQRLRQELQKFFDSEVR